MAKKETGSCGKGRGSGGCRKKIKSGSCECPVCHEILEEQDQSQEEN